MPILDDGNFGVVTFYDPADASLVQMDVESPGEVRGSFAGWEQYLADLMIQISESGVDNDRLRRVAELVGFREVERLFAFFQDVAALSDEEYRAARRRFVASEGA